MKRLFVHLIGRYQRRRKETRYAGLWTVKVTLKKRYRG